MPEKLLECQLFGCEANTLTEKNVKHIGAFEHAHKGTLFLDRVDELPLTAEGKHICPAHVREGRG